MAVQQRSRPRNGENRTHGRGNRGGRGRRGDEEAVEETEALWLWKGVKDAEEIRRGVGVTLAMVVVVQDCGEG